MPIAPEHDPSASSLRAAQAYLSMATAAIQILRQGRPIAGEPITAGNLGPYLPLIADMAHTLDRLRIDGASITARRHGMEAFWLAVRADPQYAELAAAVDALDAATATDGHRAASPGSGGVTMADAPRMPLVVRMADVAPELVDWLWYPYLPRGKLTLLEGDPGTGKTWLALALAAALTRGRIPAGGSDAPAAAPATVLYLTGEDGLADTLRPRLDAAGADVARVHVLVGWQQGEIQGGITLGDLGPLASAIKRVRPALVVIDPIQAYMGASVDIHRANETRPILAALAALGERYGCTPLCIRHLSKASQDRAIYRGLGSIDFAAAARSILLAGQDPRDPHRRILAHAKSSLAPLGPSLAYELREGLFAWAGESPLAAEDLLRPQATEEERSALDEAQDWLRETLAGGPMPAKAVQRAARQAGISEITLRRARATIVTLRKAQEPGQPRGSGVWMWRLKDDHDAQGPLGHRMITFTESQNNQSDQEVTSVNKDAQVITFIEHQNGQEKQQVTRPVKDDHSVSLGSDGKGNHLCAHGPDDLLPEGERWICGACLGMPPERIDAIRRAHH